jgi:hypothetical protein
LSVKPKSCNCSAPRSSVKRSGKSNSKMESFPICGPIINNKSDWFTAGESREKWSKKKEGEREQEKRKARSMSVALFTFPGCLEGGRVFLHIQ